MNRFYKSVKIIYSANLKEILYNLDYQQYKQFGTVIIIKQEIPDQVGNDN